MYDFKLWKIYIQRSLFFKATTLCGCPFVPIWIIPLSAILEFLFLKSESFLNACNLRRFTFSSSHIILHIQRLGQEWLVTMSNNLIHLQRKTICHPCRCSKEYAAGSRHTALRETAKIYCSTSALEKVITYCHHWREAHNWIYELQMCLLNIDHRNHSKIMFLQITYEKMLTTD